MRGNSRPFAVESQGIMATKRIPIALQTWSVREDMKADFARTLGTIAKIGFAGVELAGDAYFGANNLKPALDHAGLKVAGLHVSYAALRTDANAIISDALQLGTRHIVVSWWPNTHFVSRAGWGE